ncbi:MAG: COX15/CtaA family protein [Cytophagales bacterium]|nr:COX15/CtaA family protein [Cytophagales bacterium]
MNWLKPTPAALHKLTYLLVFLTFDLILFGAFTRLTDSGLGCPDWPGCYASATPLGAAAHIDAAQTLMPTGPVTHTKAWIEMLHRYFASAVGALIVLRLIWTVQLKQKLTLPIITFLWVCLQGVFGAFTVTMKLQPLIVTLHLLGGMVLLMLLVLQTSARTELVEVPAQNAHPQAQCERALRWFLVCAFACVWLQIFFGAWVSTNYAVLACNEFPTCLNGAWLPASASDWHQGFTLWRELGTAALPALTAIHLTHRIFAVIVLVAITGLIMQLKQYPALRKLKRWLMIILTLQIITGISNVVLGWPLLAAVMHTGGAAGLVLVLTRIWTKSTVQAESVKALHSTPSGSVRTVKTAKIER